MYAIRSYYAEWKVDALPAFLIVLPVTKTVGAVIIGKAAADVPHCILRMADHELETGGVVTAHCVITSYSIHYTKLYDRSFVMVIRIIMTITGGVKTLDREVER